MNMSEYRHGEKEVARIADLMSLVPTGAASIIDVGARDGYLALQLADRFPTVIALDLELPVIADERIRCVKGNATALDFDDASIDVIFCAEVLEHIPGPALEAACAEFGRVARQFIVIGVPYRQDLRHGRTTCLSCGADNPPWGHVNSFDETRMASLLPGFRVSKISYVGQAEKGSNALSTLLFDLAGNPYGTYNQQEPCVACGGKLNRPTSSLLQRALARAAHSIRLFHNRFRPAHANWIHVLYERAATTSPK